MLSVSTGDGRMDVRGHVQGSNPSPKTVQIQEPAKPKQAKRSESTSAPGRGRQIRQGSVADSSSSNNTTKRPKKPRTIEELDRRVENDALDLLNMKKEIAAKQKLEVKKAMQTLIGVKKEYDVIKAENDTKRAALNRVKDQVITLRGVDAAVHQSSSRTAELCKTLTKQLAMVEEGVNAEQRTLDMQKLMRDRCSVDTHKIKIEAGEIEVSAEKLRHDLASVQATLLISRRELTERELKLEKWKEDGKNRRKDRNHKMQMLHSIVAEGQSSVSIVRSSFFVGSPGSSPIATASSRVSGFPNSPDRGDFKYNLAPGETPKKPRPQSTEGRQIAAPEEDFVTPANEPAMQAKRLNLEQIEELFERFQTRDTRMEKLEQLEVDLKENLATQKLKKAELTEEIFQVKQKVTALASQRQVYQDVENQTRSLNGVRKEFEECKERDYRLRVNLVALKRSIPRLLTKLTKVPHPVPTDLQVHDAVHRLTAEIHKYFKEISQALMKDATPEDVAQMRGEEDEEKSEINKLHSMPGFQKMQKELYFNMMGARPDDSSQNVRIIADKARSKTNTPHENMLTKHQTHTEKHVKHSKKDEMKRKKDELYGGPDAAESPVVDRAMVKRISALVFARDGKGVIPEALAKKDKAPEPKKKAFVFRD